MAVKTPNIEFPPLDPLFSPPAAPPLPPVPTVTEILAPGVNA
jgi:hypothetical protein